MSINPSSAATQISALFLNFLLPPLEKRQPGFQGRAANLAG